MPQNVGSSAQSIGGSSTSSTLPTQPARKPRVALACKRCKRRKQRCDGNSPVCSSCERSGNQCIYEKAIRPHYPGGKTLYINALEERIAFLEARLPAYAEDHFENESSKTDASPRRKGSLAQNPESPPSHHGSQSDEMEGGESNSIVDGVAYLSLCATGTTDNSPGPFYLGSSSGATIARMIQTSLFRKSGGRAIPKSSQYVQEVPPSFSSPTMAHSPTMMGIESVFDFPYPEQARLLFDTFFDRLHTRWPLLDRKVYSALFEKQYDQPKLPVIERSIMHLIYAIAARFLQLTRNPCGVDSERHLVAAIEPMDYILEQHSLGTVQFLLLLAVHGQRSPYGSGAWSQVRYAVSLAIELGLHRERKAVSRHCNARDLEIRRRVFWSCYSLDRSTSVLLGRAFAIADRDINVGDPSTSVEFWDLTHSEPAEASSSKWSNIEPFIHITKLDRLQSRIHRTVFRVDKDVLAGPPDERQKLDQKMVSMRQDLDHWLETVPQPPKDRKKITWMYDPESANHDSHDFYSLQYHKSILALLTILLPTLDPSDHRFATAAHSAASVCIAYKRLNQQKTLSYTMISLHSCFVAGLTLVYCTWRNRDLFGYDVFEATQACSQSLTIFGEKWAGAVKYRDIFDALSGSLFKTLVNPNGQGTSMPLDLQRPSARKSRQGDTAGAAQRAPPPESQPTQTMEHSMSEMVSDAVKEAFMEVDDEAPGGWQGWRMWNEMLGDGKDEGAQIDGMSAAYGQHFDMTGMQAMDDGQHYDPMDASGWDFGGVQGLR
ncbi:fungal specific transcription factor domain-containing protein [Emericellopsis cladophorae]|uniref:Fungal specific transcription factor domain-containing protein n=1 Tax=Emericellopsis cladophorae TaxID=2686198 RepID=A0A9P9XVR0_9HYPO|nr:fungal specific transcription factor domain-containing protein [Emericellopsis cladophorae]KAI6778561.1 fungal specific transcription factor domain-containing protein [Emericellopsis cladophorae]